MFHWIEKQPVRFMGLAWFLSFVIGWIMMLLIDFVLSSFFPINSGNISPAFAVSVSLFGFTVAGFISGLATATLVRIKKGEISQTSFNLIVFGWTLTVTVVAMLYFLVTSLMVQYENLG
jgi:hypothetical protein